MSQENVEVVKRILDGWATGEFDAEIAELDRHVTFVVAPSFPDPVVTNGPAGITDYMTRFLEQWERFSMEATDVRAVGDTVVAEAIQRGKGRASGVQLDVQVFALFTFRGSRIIRIEIVLEKADALEATGLRE